MQRETFLSPKFWAFGSISEHFGVLRSSLKHFKALWTPKLECLTRFQRISNFGSAWLENLICLTTGDLEESEGRNPATGSSRWSRLLKSLSQSSRKISIRKFLMEMNLQKKWIFKRNESIKIDDIRINLKGILRSVRQSSKNGYSVKLFLSS